jgi:hypothetical protein
MVEFLWKQFASPKYSAFESSDATATVCICLKMNENIL